MGKVVYILFWLLLFLDFSYLSYFCDLSNQSLAFFVFQSLLLTGLLFVLFRETPACSLRPEGPIFVSDRIFGGLLLAGCGWRTLASFWGHPWPTGDEALQAFLGLHLSNHWEWRYFYTVGQHPPLSIWISAFLLSWFPSAHFFFGSCSALVGLLTLWVWTTSIRKFLPRDLGVMFGALMALSFWPVFSGEFYLQMVPLFEGMVLWAAGQYFERTDRIQKRWMAFIWGTLTGLGFFTYSSWVAVALASLLFFLLSFKKEKDVSSVFFYFVPFALTSAPFFYFAVQERFGAHLFEIALTNSTFSFAQKGENLVSYWTSLWWGPLSRNASNGPVWGGFLNPILGVFFFRGLLGLWKNFRDPLSWGLSSILVWSMVPGMITADYPSLYRIIQVMPWVLIVASLGLWAFYREWSKFSWGRPLVAALLFFSILLDGVHWAKANGLSWPSFRSSSEDPTQAQNQRIYRDLQERALAQGPGLIFCDFLLLSRNHSLSVETYPFNAALNPRRDPQKARWAALIVNRHQEGPLSKRFPLIQWIPLPSGQPEEDGGLSLGFLPLDPSVRPLIDPWVKAHRFFHERQFEAESILNDPVLYQKAAQDLVLGYPLMEGDPFLESLYGPWIAQYHFRDGLGPNLQALRRALEKGYPTADLFLKYGNFLYLNGQKAEALKAYSLAAKTQPNYTNAQDILDYLQKNH
jgi:hypothetical protein